jgi:hypothetical protein
MSKCHEYSVHRKAARCSTSCRRFRRTYTNVIMSRVSQWTVVSCWPLRSMLAPFYDGSRDPVVRSSDARCYMGVALRQGS